MKALVVCYANIFPTNLSNPNKQKKKTNRPNYIIGPIGKTTIKATANNDINNNEIIRVCVNRTCRRQGSLEILQTLQGISPPHVSVNSCGCLGSCGAGPNLVVLPRAAFVNHCSTPARAARATFDHFYGKSSGIDSEAWIRNSLAALALRKRAENELGKGEENGGYGQAEVLLSQAIDLKPCGGVHFLYKERSAARLLMGKVAEALEDAKEALAHAPKFPEAFICQADALMALDQYDAAESSYTVAVELDPSLLRSKSFKARIAKLQEKLVASDSQ